MNQRSIFGFHERSRELLDSCEEQGSMRARARAASEGLGAAVAKIGWTFLRRGDARPTAKELLVVGVETWSAPDLDALDTLAFGSFGGSIAVFDMDQMDDMAGVLSVLPGVERVLQCPVAAHYRHNDLQDWAEGTAAVKLIAALSQGNSSAALRPSQ